MVNRLGLFGLAAFSALLGGCPDDLGKNLNHHSDSGLMAPASLKGSASKGGLEIALSWEDQATGESGYRLEISPGPFDTSGGVGLSYLILPAGITQYVYPSQPHHSYYFRVVAVTDTMESDPSNEIMILTPYALESPVIIGAYGASDTSFYLKWTLVSGATGYQIESSADSGSSWTTVLGLVPVAADLVLISGLDRGKTYYYRVTALGPLGNSAPSAFTQVSTPP